jgi:hypothetical protein
VKHPWVEFRGEVERYADDHYDSLIPVADSSSAIA